MIYVLLVALAAFLSQPAGTVFAQTPEPEAATTDPAEEKKADPYVVPDGGPDELVQYLKDLQKLRPSPQDRNATVQYMIKSSKPTLEAADKILSNESATKEQKTLAARAKFGALNILIQLRNADAADAMERFPQELEDLGLTDLAKAAKSQALSMALRKSASGAPGAAPLDEVIGKIQALVAESPDQGSFQLGYGAVSTLQQVNKVEKAAELCDVFAEIYSKSDDEKIKALAERFTAIGRRLRLMGNPMKVEGTLIDGTPLDWDSYRGKVVLVQFWATWCGFCVREIPHIEKCYNEYRDRGFDVISISLDRGQEPLDKFLEKNPIPWAVVYKEGERNPTADYYGVTGLPTLIMVDKEGKVVSLNARGPKLDEALEKLLGPPKEKKEDEEPKTDG